MRRTASEAQAAPRPATVDEPATAGGAPREAQREVPPEVPPEVPRQRPRWPWYFRLHGLLGVHLGLFLGFVCLTGSLATVSHEIEWLLFPETRGVRTETPVSWGERWDAARRAYPGVTLTSIQKTGTESSTESYLATVVGGFDRGGGQVWIYVDPTSGRVQGMRSGVTLPVFLRGLHYYLFDPTGWVFYLVSALGFVLLAIGITGLKLYRKWWRGFFSLPRRGARPRAWWGQLHRFVAVWSLAFVFVIALTSIWYLFERAGVLHWERPYPQLEQPMKPVAEPWTGEDVDRWVAIAHREIPGLQVTTLWLPWDPATPVQVQGRAGDALVRDRANRVAIDPNDDRVTAVQRAAEMGPAERWVHMADPLHFGDFAGFGSKLVWFVLGLGLTGLCWSGAVIAAKRTAGRPVQRPRRVEAPC